jgi:hypothetical protein
MKIEKEQFELYEECIHTGQVEQQDVPKLLAENPEFEAWYKERAKQYRPQSTRNRGAR